MRQADVGVLSLFASKHAADWQLCGVLISGTVSTLLWEHGFSLFSLTPVLLGLTALPVIGGCLTPEKPPYTIIVFAVGSILPFINDMPAVPMGYWPVGWIRVVLRGNSIGCGYFRTTANQSKISYLG